MLQRIRLTNFKCFEELDLACSPLTLLCGLNGMGKSSVIQGLLVLCAVSDSVAVSLPSEPVWNRDELTVRFHELLPNDEFLEAEECVDHAGERTHNEQLDVPPCSDLPFR